jgi:hypothetical protein
MHYHDNIFPFVQGSRFCYFFGQNLPGMRVLSGGSVSGLLKAGHKSTSAGKALMQG